MITFSFLGGTQKSELEHARAEIQKLKASNDNMIFVNEKLNKAYSKLLLK